MNDDRSTAGCTDSPAKRLRILFVPWDRFPPFRPAARAIFLQELPERGHRIDWLVQADVSAPEAATMEVTTGYAYIGRTNPGKSIVDRLHKHILNFWNACKMFSLIRRNQYDAIQAKDNFSAALVGLVAARMRGVPYGYWTAYPRAESSIYEGRAGIARYPALYRMRGQVMKLVLYKLILPNADCIFVQSEQMKKDIAAKGIDPGKMVPVPSSVDLRNIPFGEPADSSVLLEKDSEQWIVYLGTMKRVRQLDFVIRAFEKVYKHNSNAVLYMIGNGDHDSDLDVLKQEAARLGIESSVRFTGFLEMSVGWEYIRRADVCLSPYFPTPILNSTSPTKLVEYMAMGRPVIGNDHPEQSLVINQSGAGICVPWDESAFADAILQILCNKAASEEMGRKGRIFVEKHRTNRAMGDVVEAAYRNMVNRSMQVRS